MNADPKDIGAKAEARKDWKRLLDCLEYGLGPWFIPALVIWWLSTLNDVPVWMKFILGFAVLVIGTWLSNKRDGNAVGNKHFARDLMVVLVFLVLVALLFWH